MAGSRGFLVALEGVDGAGKSVQVERLRAALAARGRAVTALREPGGTVIGERLRDVLLAVHAVHPDALVEALLFMASRRQLVREKIEPVLSAGEIVLLDRSFLSTWVYQGVVGGVDLAFLEDLTRRVHGEAWPDRILLLDLEPAEALRRRAARDEGADGFEQRGSAYLESIATAFRRLAARYPDIVTVVPALGSVDEVAERCLAAFDAVTTGAG